MLLILMMFLSVLYCRPWLIARAINLIRKCFAIDTVAPSSKLNLIVPKDGAALDSLLAEFATWYNVIRPHEHLYGLTPDEIWRGIDLYKTAPKSVKHFTAWDGSLCSVFFCPTRSISIIFLPY